MPGMSDSVGASPNITFLGESNLPAGSVEHFPAGSDGPGFLVILLFICFILN
jgi:hypothetical protein